MRALLLLFPRFYGGKNAVTAGTPVKIRDE
jgi:hypothetical protein